MRYVKPSLPYYRFAQAVCWTVSKLLFHNKVLRNEIRNQDGPFVVIANHQCALDFVNLIGAARTPMSFVISRSFYSTLPIKGYLKKIGVIPKQQFQTTVTDMKNMKAVIDNHAPLVIYPAGLMCEDGLSTPIPAATYKFLKWLGVDVYVARTSGTYFVMPKWTGFFRPGRTTIDIYKLFSSEELKTISADDLKERTDKALLFDAYREQENQHYTYLSNNDIRGLDQVLYRCPHCSKEFTMTMQGKNTLQCASCGYEAEADRYGFLHDVKNMGTEFRYVSDWSNWIYRELTEQIEAEPDFSIENPVRIHLVDENKDKFYPAGEALLKLDHQGFHMTGTLKGEPLNKIISTQGLPTLPFSPGKYLEIQDGPEIYRCYPEDGRLVMKYINLVKVLFERVNHEFCAVSSKNS